MTGWSEWLGPTFGVSGGALCIVQTLSYLESTRAGKNARPRDFSKVRVVCYFFSLSVQATAVAGAWLAWSGQVAGAGEPMSSTARWAFWLAGETLVFEQEVLLVAVLLSLVIVPQLLNYLVAGLFGVAGGTRFGAWCLRFVFWTAIKGVAVAAGVSIAWGGLAFPLHWPNAHDVGPARLVGQGLLGLAIAVVAATWAGPLEDDALAALRRRLAPGWRWLRPIHGWLTRHRAAPDSAGRRERRRLRRRAERHA